MSALQSFFESTGGRTAVIGLIVVLFAIILYSGKGKKTDTKILVISALLVALAVVLNQIKLFTMPQGGSVSPFAMVPIVLIGYFFGVRRGVIAGMCMGLMELVLGPYVIHPVQLLVDYPLAFGALGIGAVFRNQEKIPLIKCYLPGVLGRYICAVISGIVFFGDYIPDPKFNAVTWSLFYNITYLGIEAVATTVVLCIPAVNKAFARLKTQAVSTT